MLLMKKLYVAILCLCSVFAGSAQIEHPLSNIPHMRQLFHDNIDNNQQIILHLNGKNDEIFAATSDIDINLQVTQILKVHVNNMQAFIESDSTLSESEKFRWLRGVNDMLSGFITDYRSKNIKGILLGDLIMAYEEAMHAEMQHQSIAEIVYNNELEVGNILIQNFALKDNSGLQESKDLLVLKMCQRNPENILPILGNYTSLPFADSLITAVAYRNPEEVYNYASASDNLAKKIRMVNEPLVKSIGQMAKMESGRFCFPFLDNIFHNKISIPEILKLKDDDNGYYKLLANTEMEYAARIRNGDTPFVIHVLTEKLRAKAIEPYINEINALHEEKSDAVRFRKIDSLTPQELYYLCVLGEEEIYTSSYLGVYNRIFQRMGVMRSDTLLNQVNYDFYKKFIRMAAAYNELDDFLKKMDQESAEKLMKSFVNNLEKTTSLEDAVDVANSYASINDPALKKLILSQVQINLVQNKRLGNQRGLTIYRLLNTIFLSMENNDSSDAAAQLGIPPVYNMPIQQLKDSTGKVIIEQFFYGDKDGLNTFNGFLNRYSNANWKIIKKPEWVEVSAVKGIPVVIYANRPLDGEKELDAKAQQHLGNYLDSINANPTVIIHRGHSYYVKQTIEQLPHSAKVILLGSCGGYQSLNTVLNICPGAHIIASKQVGTGVVNITLIEAITETLRLGKDLNWPLMWKSLETKLIGQYKEKFEDYVPPHKNLGAIFIMAYNKQINAN
jgi:hypothetical protein